MAGDEITLGSDALDTPGLDLLGITIGSECVFQRSRTAIPF
jgi:hypothetical protein